jgi:hypothetical protein
MLLDKAWQGIFSFMFHLAKCQIVDYSMRCTGCFTDWELLDGDVLPEGSVPDTDMDQDIPERSPQQQLDIYKLSSVDYDFTNGQFF